MSEEAFSWFKRSKKQKIDSSQDPLDLLTHPNLKISDFDALMDKMREQQTYALRTLFPGTYKADDLTLMVSGQLPSHIFDLVLQHEYTHALFGQQHYGEMIRRLESFGILVVR